MNNKRDDVHRPSVIVPTDYDHVLFYNCATTSDGWPIPSFGIDCTRDNSYVDDDGRTVIGKHNKDGRCCVIGLSTIAGARVIGGVGRCTVCGAAFVYGEVWRHRPSGHYIHVGHICSTSYGLLSDYTEFERASAKAARRAIAAAEKIERQRMIAETCAAYHGLESALMVQHDVVVDISRRFYATGHISAKQIDLVLKIAERLASEKDIQNINAPCGRLTFEAIIGGTKYVKSYFGDTLKMLVHVAGEGGVWLGWSTVPGSIQGHSGPLRGRRVRITATVEPSKDDPTFAILKRPRAELLPDPPKMRIIKNSTGKATPGGMAEHAFLLTKDAMNKLHIADTLDFIRGFRAPA